MGLRPGVPAARVLWKVADPAEWEKSLCKYDVALRAVGVKRKKEKDLVKWDAAMDTLKTRFEAQGKLSLSDLETVMNWKLTKGKFRPLMNLFLSNSPSLVQKATEETLGSLNAPVAKALAPLCQLKGIGPATASAVLACLRPDRFPFMADEAMEAAGVERLYTVKAYEEFAKVLCNKAASLGEPWTAERVGRALWAEATSSDLLSSMADAPPKVKKLKVTKATEEKEGGAMEKAATAGGGKAGKRAADAGDGEGDEAEEKLPAKRRRAPTRAAN
ncbi:hypothetical protein T484DRAFT_1884217 [Baffinella frigidus]|nr:hypothetical protein T484DRAFT_1884217 [Cryptophyta sp. CCMP2293]